MSKRVIIGSAVVLVALGSACDPQQSGTAPSQAGDTKSPATAAAKPGASGGPGAAAGTAPTPSGAQADAPAPSGDEVAPSALGFVETKVTVDETTGDPKEDNFRFFHLWGELKNNSTQWVESIVGDIRYFDSAGKELAVDSIGTAVKQDVGDTSPGERVSGEVMYVAPGATVPLHHIRALAKLGGKYGSYKISLRPARIVTKYPEGVIEGLKDEVATVANEHVPSSSPLEHRVVAATLRNKGTLGCRKPGLVVGFYDASGKLTDLSSDDAQDDTKHVLAPGGTIPVKVFTLVGADAAWKAKATIKTWVSCSEPYD